jgi:hypothetical protein
VPIVVGTDVFVDLDDDVARLADMGFDPVGVDQDVGTTHDVRNLLVRPAP